MSEPTNRHPPRRHWFHQWGRWNDIPVPGYIASRIFQARECVTCGKKQSRWV